ncbi:3-ketoacyl-CoA thiolase [Atractiella rhizophila]|nr:3-ketoacyl-CoA thiolase [Atractiella rhizophila]
MALRSPLCKAKKGGFKDMAGEELLASFFEAIIPKLGVATELVEDIVVGTVLPPGATYRARAAMLSAGWPETTGVQTINRFCSSGLMAVSSISNAIRNDEIEVGLAVGFESMSAFPDRGASEMSKDVLQHQLAKDAAMPMGWTSENVAGDFKITRRRMDELAALSYQRAEKAQKEGIFDAEIVPVQAYTKDADGNKKSTLVTKDDGIRYGTTVESLLKIRPAFPQWAPAQTTGGNASQLTDGAAAVLMMKRSKAEALGLPILAKHVATSTVGLSPRIMGIGPSVAIPKVLKRTGLKMEDIDLFEVNEAFTSMYAYMVDIFGCPLEKTNVNGGATALGHPLGTTGARQVATGLNEIRRRKGKILCTSMCIGTGMGAAAIFVAEY